MNNKISAVAETLKNENDYKHFLIAVVDDDPVVLSVFGDYLNVLGYTNIRLFGSGQEILKFLETSKPEVLIADIKLKGEFVTGIDIARKAKKEFSDMMLVYISGEEYDEYPALVSTLPDAYLTKPISLNAFYTQFDIAIRKYYEKCRLNNEKNELNKKVDEVVSLINDFTVLAKTDTLLYKSKIKQLAIAIGKQLNLTGKELEILSWVCDIYRAGMIGVPDEYKNNTGKLTEAQLALVRENIYENYNILIKYPDFKEIAEIIYQQEERLDGSGYPRGLKGHEIYLLAKILKLTGDFVSIISPKRYRDSKGDTSFAIKEILSKRDIWYDPKCVDACVKLFRQDGFDFEEQT